MRIGRDDLGHHIGEYSDESKESTTPEIETIRGLLEIFCCFFSWTDPWDITSTLLDILSDISRVECDRYVEERESYNKEKIYSDVDPTWILHREIGRKP